jgi:hypothetical protein
MSLPLLFTEVDDWLAEERRQCLAVPRPPRSMACMFHHGVLSAVLFTPDASGASGDTVAAVVCRLLPAAVPDQVLVVFGDHAVDALGAQRTSLWVHRWTRRSGRWRVRRIPVAPDPVGGHRHGDRSDEDRGPWGERLCGAMDRVDVVPGLIDTRFPHPDFELLLRPDGPLATLEPLSLDN